MAVATSTRTISVTPTGETTTFAVMSSPGTNHGPTARAAPIRKNTTSIMTPSHFRVEDRYLLETPETEDRRRSRAAPVRAVARDGRGLGRGHVERLGFRAV